ncbi:hypothetical protein QTA57_12090 [Fontisubflavum oceani]|uniref:hypothetical protein n=1 Tax=Fontisubflavum oceani TaxID=2978973 RepID=UPI0025B4ADBC|nr:hypothetical protein [Fontisubflavum oceani]WJY20578.1 hypothetical protein QTA57_12090 [Fontisubflavum oceani]
MTAFIPTFRICAVLLRALPAVCLATGLFMAAPALADNSCPWAFDGECDEPGIGTGLCGVGTDTADCGGGTASGPNSCQWAFDGECDEPGMGTGLCAAGTDTADCASVGGPNSCQWAFDGECDEPGIGTGLCAAGTDTADCSGVGRPAMRIPAIGRSTVNVTSRVLAPAYVPQGRIRRIVPVVGATTTYSTLAHSPMTAIVMSQTA